jgi:hypothetical protein
LEKYFDVDEILRYFAAHTFVVNLDSYISSMSQNYYIYEQGGKLTILPWDYHLAFGSFQSDNASYVVNFPIDTPVSDINMEDRPLLNKLLEVVEYREKYHEYLRQIVEGYFESGLWESTILALDAKINEYVKNDASAFYTYEQYEASLPHLIELGRLRAESIKGQLDGTIPSTHSGQKDDSSTLVDVSGLDLSALGSLGGGINMGGGGMGPGGNFGPDGIPDGGMGPGGNFEPDGMPDGGMGPGGNFGEIDGSSPGDDGQNLLPDGNGGAGSLQIGGDGTDPDSESSLHDRLLIQQAVQIIKEAGGELTEEVKTALAELGLTEEQLEKAFDIYNNLPDDGEGGGRLPGGNGQNALPDGNGKFPGEGGISNFPDSNGTEEKSNQYGVIVIVLLLILVTATVFIAKSKKI